MLLQAVSELFKDIIFLKSAEETRDAL
jgi:hypothetical protein